MPHREMKIEKWNCFPVLFKEKKLRKQQSSLRVNLDLKLWWKNFVITSKEISQYYHCKWYWLPCCNKQNIYRYMCNSEIMCNHDFYQTHHIKSDSIWSTLTILQRNLLPLKLETNVNDWQKLLVISPNENAPLY